MQRRWLITGATGLLSDYLVEACSAHGRVTTTARSGADRICDLADPNAVRTLITELEPDAVIHAAGLTDVDRCEREPDEAFSANRDNAANLTQALPPAARLVFISTDQVYPNTPGPHAEDDTGPVNIYGQSKLEGERAALTHPGAVVLRTNFFGPSRRPGRNSLSDFVVQSLTGREPVTFFDDVLFSPLHMTTLAALVVEAVERGLTGVFNAGCRDGNSKAAFALAIARHKHLQTETSQIGRSTALPARVRRPLDLRLDVTRLETEFGRAMPSLEEEIARL